MRFEDNLLEVRLQKYTDAKLDDNERLACEVYFALTALELASEEVQDEEKIRKVLIDRGLRQYLGKAFEKLAILENPSEPNVRPSTGEMQA